MQQQNVKIVATKINYFLKKSVLNIKFDNLNKKIKILNFDFQFINSAGQIMKLNK